MTSVKAATLVEPRRLEVREYPYPDALEPGAVLLRMIASGICGTDKHTFRGETDQYPGSEHARRTPFPLIQGHENVATVAAIGPGGATAWDGRPLAVGDRVVPAPNRACGRCHPCRRGFPYYLCDALEGYGNSLSASEAPHLFGGWAEFLYVRAGTAMFRVPDAVPDDVAVLTEIFAVTHSLERAARLSRPATWRPGDSVVVVGVGALGQAHAVKAALMGAGTIVAVDRSEKRLALASRLAGAHAVRAGEDARAAVMELTHGEGADLVVDATGFPDSFGDAMSMVRDGGTLIEVGAFVDMGDATFNPAVLCGRNLALLGVAGEDLLAYEGTLALMARHHETVAFADMISHRFAVDDAPEAMVVALDPDTSAKVLITPDRSGGA
jgi:L-iditol 2-dehydrogenase